MTFTKAIFKCPARFQVTSFYGPTYFSKCIFNDEAQFFRGTRFNDDVTFKSAKFRTNYSINQAEQRESLDAPVSVFFSDVEFSQDAFFSNVTFGNANFSRVYGRGDTGMDTVFRKKVDFRDAKFSKKVDFTDVDIEQASIKLKLDQLFHNGTQNFEGKDFLSSLETNFKKRGQLIEAGEVRYKAEDLKSKRRLKSGNFMDDLLLSGGQASFEMVLWIFCQALASNCCLSCNYSLLCVLLHASECVAV